MSSRSSTAAAGSSARTTGRRRGDRLPSLRLAVPRRPPADRPARRGTDPADRRSPRGRLRGDAPRRRAAPDHRPLGARGSPSPDCVAPGARSGHPLQAGSPKRSGSVHPVQRTGRPGAGLACRATDVREFAGLRRFHASHATPGVDLVCGATTSPTTGPTTGPRGRADLAATSRRGQVDGAATGPMVLSTTRSSAPRLQDRATSGNNRQSETAQPMAEPADPWIGIEAAADHLAIPVRTLYRLAQRGQVPAAKVGRTWRFRRSLLDAHLATNGHLTGDLHPSPDERPAPRPLGDGPVAFLTALGELASALVGRGDPATIAGIVTPRVCRSLMRTWRRSASGTARGPQRRLGSRYGEQHRPLPIPGPVATIFAPVFDRGESILSPTSRSFRSSPGRWSRCSASARRSSSRS